MGNIYDVDHDQIISNDQKWWNEHIILNFDYHKAIILNDIIIIDKIKNKLSILETPPNLNEMINLCYNLINTKNMYSVLDSIDNKK